MSHLPRTTVALACLAVLAAAAPAHAASTDTVRLSLDDAAARLVNGDGGLVSSGSAKVHTALVADGDGAAIRVAGRASGFALRLPAYSASTTPGRAVLSVTNATSLDALTPGTARLEFGADIRLDAVSEGTGRDNGNNVLQRGRWGDRSQYKLELDARFPGCRVKGDAGSVYVKSPVPVNSTDWYHLDCTRDLGSVVLEVVHYLPSGSSSTSVTTRDAATGRLVTTDPATPLSIGGKLDARGHLAWSSDQLNGQVDNAFVRIGP